MVAFVLLVIVSSVLAYRLAGKSFYKMTCMCPVGHKTIT